MSDADSYQKKGNTSAVIGWSGIGGGAIGIGALVYSLLTSIQSDADTALKVAAQHGQEFVEVRASIDRLREEMLQRTSDRYTKSDGTRDALRADDHFAILERQIDLLEAQFKNHDGHQ